MKRTQNIRKSKGKSKTKMAVCDSNKAKHIVRKNGWVLDRVSGSHYIYTHPDNEKILTIPLHLNRIVWERVVNEYDLKL